MLKFKKFMSESVELDEANKGATPARYDMIKRAAQKAQGLEDDPRASRAAKRDMKAKGAQRGMAPVKKDLDEARAARPPKLKGNNGPYTRQQIEKAAKEAKVDIGAKSRMMMALRNMNESVELDEGRNEALKALEKLANSGGIDKADFQKAHDLYKANKLNDLRKHIYGLDTDPSEAIADVINRHDSKAFNSMYPRAKSGDYIRKIVIDHGGK